MTTTMIIFHNGRCRCAMGLD